MTRRIDSLKRSVVMRLRVGLSEDRDHLLFGESGARGDAG